MASCWFMCPVMVTLEMRKLEKKVSTRHSGRCFIIACNVCFYDSWLVPSSLALPKTCKNQLVAYHKNCSHDSFLRRSFYLVRSLRTGRCRYEPQKNIKRGSSETNENKPEGCSLVRWVISIIVNYYNIYFFSEHESLLDSLFTASRPHSQKWNVQRKFLVCLNVFGLTRTV